MYLELSRKPCHAYRKILLENKELTCDLIIFCGLENQLCSMAPLCPDALERGLWSNVCKPRGHP